MRILALFLLATLAVCASTTAQLTGTDGEIGEGVVTPIIPATGSVVIPPIPSGALGVTLPPIPSSALDGVVMPPVPTRAGGLGSCSEPIPGPPAGPEVGDGGGIGVIPAALLKGYVLIPWTVGELSLVLAIDDDHAYALIGAGWIGPLPLEVIPGADEAVKLGTSGCWYPPGQTSGPVPVSIGGSGATLGIAVADYKSALEGYLDAGWTPTSDPCD